MGSAGFCTSIHCMDGRVQLPINTYLCNRYGVLHVDTLTEPGPCRLIADRPGDPRVSWLLKKVELSVRVHRSRVISLATHDDCAGNPECQATRLDHLERAVAHLTGLHPHLSVVGLWVDGRWQVHPV